ncbi:putative Golgi membrane protein [Talaromyces proteolyticus]|uniref:Protein CASP n=1 Tax=Talaromyces proteolyticus TaxID=1131652 RepID=A0AAD4KTK0_9EURO|nr:putative Golgi membrane protein [Talaromyces proteolyticus]KAH8699016.1 putative Golgi membrane protein [Talaromyces proteolyticus]
MDVFAASESVNMPDQEKPDGNTSTESRSEEANKFQRAISAWRGIDLTNTIPKLDTTASEIVANQRDALVQRKDLAQKTKDFRKLDDASKLTEYKGLLKAYQTFIDLLTNHGKTSSSSFLQIYSSLSEVPDPYPLLEASVDSLVASEDTVPKLTAEKEHLQKSVEQLTSQLEQTEKRLEEESTTRKNLEDTQDSKTKEIESSWEAVLSEKTNNWEAKEKSLEEKIENQERLLKELKASLEVSQRLDKGEEVDTSLNAATAAELEIVTSDLEKTSLRLAEVEARNEQMRLELAQAASHPHAEQKTIDDDPAYLRLQSENSSLLRKLDAARYDRDTERHNWETKLRQNERENAKFAAEKDELRSKLEKYADYEEIKRELEVIKSIEFSTGDDDDAGDVTEEINSNANGAAKSKENTLEQLLMARNKKLTNELTVLRVSHRDLQSQIDTLQEEVSKTKRDLEKSQQLSTTLENDLFRLQKGSHALPSAAMSVAGTYTSRYHSSRRGGGTSPTSSIISGFDQAAASSNTMEAIRAGEPVGGGSGLLPMIQAQRDRFKQKNAELEEELSNTYANVKSLRQEIAALQKDNLNLYEKTRYVSTYSRGQSSAATSASTFGNRPSATSTHPSGESSSSLSLDRYQSAYEAQISPFAAFRGREATRAYKRMSLPERFVFSVTRVVLANRTSRNLFAGYCLALHILLFVMLYMMSAVEIEKHHIDNLASGAAAAVAAAAGGDGAIRGGAGAGGQHLQGDDWQQEGFS